MCVERVNTLLVSGRDAKSDAARRAHRAGDQEGRAARGRRPEYEDSTGPSSRFSIGADAGLLDEARAAAVAKALEGTGLSAQPMFTYLANSLRVGDREVPYSLVTACERSERLERPERIRTIRTRSF